MYGEHARRTGLCCCLDGRWQDTKQKKKKKTILPRLIMYQEHTREYPWTAQCAGQKNKNLIKHLTLFSFQSFFLHYFVGICRRWTVPSIDGGGVQRIRAQNRFVLLPGRWQDTKQKKKKTTLPGLIMYQEHTHEYPSTARCAGQKKKNPINTLLFSLFRSFFLRYFVGLCRRRTVPEGLQ